MSSQKPIILFVASTAVFFEALDIAVLNMVMPVLENWFRMNTERVQWVQTIYILFYGGFLLLGGRLADVYGRKKMFLIGSALFLASSLGAGLSHTFYSLFTWRALQGLAAAFAIPSALSIVTNTFPLTHERNKALGVFSSFAAVGSGLGLALGGLIATRFGWQWTFLLNVPVIALVMILAAIHIPSDPEKHKAIDPNILSGLMLTGVLIILSLILHDLSTLIHKPLHLAWALFCTILLLTALVRREKHHAFPLFNPQLFHRTSTIMGNLCTLFLGILFLGYLFILSLYLQQQLHFTTAQAGLLLCPFSAVCFLIARYLAPAILNKLGMVNTGIAGMTLLMAGPILLILSIELHSTTLWPILLSISCVTGTGIAVCFVSLTGMALQGIPAAQQGVAAALNTTSYFLGAGLGLSMIGMLMSSTRNTLHAAEQYYVYPLAFLAIIALLTIGLLARSSRKMYRAPLTIV